MQYLKQDQDVREVVKKSDTSKVLEIVRADVNKLIARIRETMQTGANKPIKYRYYITLQAKDVDYELLHAESDAPEDAGDVIHGFAIDNHKDIGTRAMIDSIEMFVEQFKRAMQQDGFDESIPVTREDMYEIRHQLLPLMKALQICAELEKLNRG